MCVNLASCIHTHSDNPTFVAAVHKNNNNNNTHLVHLVRVAFCAEQDARDARVSVAGGRVERRVAILCVLQCD